MKNFYFFHADVHGFLYDVTIKNLPRCCRKQLVTAIKKPALLIAITKSLFTVRVINIE
ncbi:MAG: hypothetical protein ABI472_08315 [Ginsengibacter sp.]